MIEARCAWVETRSRRSRSGVTVPAELLDKVPDRRRRLLFLRAVADVLIRRLGFSLATVVVILVRTVFGVFLRLVTVFSHCRRRRRDSSLLLLGLRFLRGRRRRLRGARTDTPTPPRRSRRPTATALPSSLLLQRVPIRAHFDARSARRSRVGGDFSSSSLDGRAELRRSVRGRRFGLLRGPLNIRLRGARRDFLLLLPRVIVVVVGLVVLVVLVFSLLRMTVLDPVVVMVVVAVVMPVREVLLLVSIAVRLLNRRTFFLVVLVVFLLLVFVVLIVLFDVAGSANSSRNRSRSVERLRGGDCVMVVQHASGQHPPVSSKISRRRTRERNARYTLESCLQSFHHSSISS